MARKYEIITELYHRTQQAVTRPQEWQRFLTAAACNYKLPFDEMLLVYAQRPDATAVLEIERWNEQFGRWVNKGATGIAVFDKEHTGRTRLKHYFDISDTHESRFSRPVPIWTVRREYERELIEALENSFGELENKVGLVNALLSAAKNAVEDNIHDYLSELNYCRQDSFLEELDEFNVEVEYRNALQSSIGYMLLSRCGIDPILYFNDDDFRNVVDFNTPETLNALGTATGDIGKMCLGEIARTVQSLSRTPIRTFAKQETLGYNKGANEPKQITDSERSLEDEAKLYNAGRLQAPEPVATPRAGGTPWEVRLTAPEVSEGESQSDLYQPSDIRQIERTPDGDRADSPLPHGADDRRDGESTGRDGEPESLGSDEMGGADEQHPALGGGSDPLGADLQLTPQESEPQANDDWLAEGVPVVQLNEEAEGELPHLLDEKHIMAIIANKDDDLKFKKSQIEMYFTVHPDVVERAEYLKSAYQDRYTEIIADGERLGYKPQENGLLMWEGAYLSRKRESVFSWSLVAEWTAQLIDRKEYFINTDFRQLKSQQNQQLTLFDMLDTDVADTEPIQQSFFPRFEVSQQVIDEALCIGANDENSRLIICGYFMKDKPDNATFLQQHYGENGAGFYFEGRKISVWYNAEGIRIADGETAQRSSATIIPWEQAAKRVRELLDLGRYMPQAELDKVVGYEQHTIADSLLYLYREIEDEEKQFFPTVREIYETRGGFPELSKRIEELLRTPEGLQTLVNEAEPFLTAYDADPNIMRFRHPKPHEVIDRLRDLQREPILFTAAEGYNPQRRFYISQDEIDKILRGSKSNTDGRLATYAFYRTHPEQKERENFLKKQHGEYSGSYSGNDSLTYTQGKGIVFSHGSISEPYAKVELKWNAVEKRVSALITQNKFLSDDDRATMPEYELRQLARRIHSFFIDAPGMYPRPYQANAIADYWEGVDEVYSQISDPARVDEIYQTMMLPLWEGTPKDFRHYDMRKAGMEAMQAYLNGSFSVFGNEHTLQPLVRSEIADVPEVIVLDEPVQEPAEAKSEYTVIKEQYPDAIVAYQVGDFFEFYGQDAETAAAELNIMLTGKMVDGNRLPMCGVPGDRLDTYVEMLLDRGYDVAISELQGAEHRTELLISSHKDAPIASQAVGRLEYLGSNGAIGETIEYTDEAEFIRDALEENYYGSPMNVVVYRGADGETIPLDFTSRFDPPPTGFEIIDSPYLPERTEQDEDITELLEPTYEVAEEAEVLPAETEKPLAPPKPRPQHIRFETLHPEIPADQRRNFRITDQELGFGTPTEKYNANVAAIRTLKQIEAEERLATPTEQEVLSRYVGWGGLADCFDDRNSHYEELKGLLDSEEYEAARASSLTAFYTSPVIIEGIYQALSQMGFQTGNLLEPSCGVGNFIGMLPESMADCKAYGVELDSISGRIARQLYQNSSIAVNGFEKVEMPDSFFDVAVGNVPFGDFKVLDKRYDKNHWLIHDYFFGKALDKVRPGGIVAFITSKGTMDKENSAVRKYLAQRADLIGAIRLPGNAFKRNAGTEVTSDIIFLQKRDRIIDIEPDWVHLDTDLGGIRMNSYFVQHPEMVLGNMVMESTRFGMDSACKAYENIDIGTLLSEAVSNLHAQITEYEQELPDEEEDYSIPADPGVRNFSYTIVDGKLYFRENSRMHPVSASATAENRIRGMIALRDCVRRVIEYQTENYPDDVIRQEQEKLNTLYDNYVKKYDRLFTRGNSLAFGEDSSYCLLCSLEVRDDEGAFGRKADMFTKRTIRPHVAVTRVDTASEALAVSISEKAGVDMAFMSELSGKSQEELEQELQGVIFRDIVCGETAADIPKAFVDVSRFRFVTADEYLSGKVRQKLRMAQALYEVLPAEQKAQIQPNIQALQEVQPQDLTAGEIGVRIGATWIPPEVYREFMFELLETGYYSRRRMNILYSKFSGEWNITEKNSDYGNVRALATYGTKRISAYHIFEQTLNLKDVRVFDYVEDENGNKKAVLNKKETAIAQDRQELIKQKFSEWIWKDIDRRERLCKIYNETFNAVRPREYDGSHIIFNGMNPEITLRTHQINAIAHIIYGGNTLLAHEVGAGKTFEMVAAAMEMKRLGLCSKSLIVVPNHITEQWASEWLQLYPSANILVATKKDFEKQNRRKFCGRIATGDYDAIIIGHSQFEKIPMSAPRQAAILQKQIDEILFGIQDAKKAHAERYTVKQMERTKKSLEAKLAKLNDQSRKDDLVTFEELGCDRIFIDESHYFKNLFLATKMRNVGGIAQTEAQKSSDLFMKTQYLDELTDGRGTIFATGTPISNSMVELYTIQRYLQYRTLEDTGMVHFDEWAANFGETITAIELSPEGSGYRAKTRFAKFYNLPELMSMFKECADIQTADMLNLPVPKANFHTEVIKPSELQQEMIKSLAERAEEIRGGNVDPSVDNMLRITNDGRKLALDMRLINPLAADDPNGKVSVCARNVFDIWQRTTENRGTQLVFCDLSTPKADGSFNVYDDLKRKLMAQGIPEEEIAFIHDANTEEKKKALFAKVRSGQVRVLMGSTAKMGAGTNVQDRLVALHDLDCPWRPSDLAQRLGRIVRQGNRNPEVDIYRYVTENTFDAYLYQLVENKQKFIAQIMTSKTPLRAAEDVDETALSYSEIKALATGNPLIIEKCELDMQVSKLNMLKASHLNQRYAMEEMVLRKYPETIKKLTERIAGYEQDVKLVAEHPKPKEGFAGMVINGTLETEKEAAGKAIIDVCTKMTGSDAVAFGSYRGFFLTVSYDASSNEYRMTMKGTLSHTVVLGADVYGNITRMDNALEALGTTLDVLRNELENTKNQLENAKEEMVAPFAREEELQEKAARLKELNILLNMDEKDKSLIDDQPEQDGNTPERKKEEPER